MTAADTFDAEPCAFENAIFEDSLHHVLAASRRKAAGRRSERRDKHPVEIDGQQKHLTHYDFPILHTFGRWSMVDGPCKGCRWSLVVSPTAYAVLQRSGLYLVDSTFHLPKRLANGFFNDSKALLFLVHIVKGNQEMLLAQ